MCTHCFFVALSFLKGISENSNSVDEQVRSSDNSGMRNQSRTGLSINSSVDSQGELVSKVVSDDHINGDFPSKHHVEDARHHQQSRSPSRSGRKKNYHEDVEEADSRKLSDIRKSFSSESSGEKYKASASSPLDARYNDYSSRPKSRDLDRGRSRSRSIVDDAALLRRSRRHEHDSSWDGRHGSRNLVRGDGRERNFISSERSTDREIDWERRRERERDRSREREMDVDWRRDREIYGERRREKERARSRDREWSCERIRENGRERSRDRELESERRREKQRGKSRDRGLDSERRREKVCDRSLEREADRDRKREKESDWSRDHSGANERERERKMEKTEELNQERGRERRSDRSRDKGRNIEIENDGYGDRDRYKNYKHSKRDEEETYLEKIGKNKNSNLLEGDRDKLKR